MRGFYLKIWRLITRFRVFCTLCVLVMDFLNKYTNIDPLTDFAILKFVSKKSSSYCSLSSRFANKATAKS